jgi:hypothetical protein
MNRLEEIRKCEVYSSNFVTAVLFAAAAWYVLQPAASLHVMALLIFAFTLAGAIYDLLSVKFNLKVFGWSRELEDLEKRYISDLRKKRTKSGFGKLGGALLAWISAVSLPTENPLGENIIYLLLLVYAITIITYNIELKNRIGKLKEKIDVSASHGMK